MAIGTGLALLAGSAVSAGVSASGAKKAADAQSSAAKDSTALQKYIYDQTTENFAPFLGAGKDAMSAYLYEMGLGPKPTFGGTAPKIETYTIPGTDQTVSVNGGSNGMSTRVVKGAATTGYKVGDQTFSTLSEAEDWANANKTGGTEYGGYTQSPMAKYLMQEGVDSIEGSAAASGGLYSGAALEALEKNRKTVIGADTSDYFSKLFGLTNMGMSAAGNQAGAGSSYANNVSQLNMQAANAKAKGYTGAADAMSGFIGDAAGIYGYFNNPMQAYASPTITPKANPFY